MFGMNCVDLLRENLCNRLLAGPFYAALGRLGVTHGVLDM
jgi:hypothetical protein